MASLPHDNNPLMAQRVKVVHTYRDISGHNAIIDAVSRTVETYTGATITARVGSIYIVNVCDGVLYLEPRGTAGPDSWLMPPGAYYELKGRADELQDAHICARPDTQISIMYREVYQ
jgi:hypothetical protein